MTKLKNKRINLETDSRRLEKSTDILLQFPNTGRLAADLDIEHRELLIPFGSSGYAVFYEVQDDTVIILSFKHQREAGY